MRLRQPADHRDDQQQREPGQEPEDHRPRAPAEDPATHDRRDRRRDAEDHRHLAHQPLRVVPVARIADHRASDDEADAGGQALHAAEQQQRAHVGGQRAAHRGQQEDEQATQDHPPAAEGVRQRAVHQAHQRIRQQVDADGLLHRHLVGTQLRADGRERREDGVDRERAEHRQTAQQQGQTAVRDRVGGTHCGKTPDGRGGAS